MAETDGHLQMHSIFQPGIAGQEQRLRPRAFGLRDRMLQQLAANPKPMQVRRHRHLRYLVNTVAHGYQSHAADRLAAEICHEDRSTLFENLTFRVAQIGVSIAPACVRRIASAEVVCLPLRGAKAVSNIELAWLKGDTRPLVERFKQIAESTRDVQ